MSKASTLLNSNVSGKIANHSCRKTSITNILNSDFLLAEPEAASNPHGEQFIHVLYALFHILDGIRK